MKTKIKSLFLALAMIIGTSTLLVAQPNGQGPRGQQGPPDQARIVNIIPDITADQETKIDGFRADMMKKVTPLEADLQIKEAELNALMASDASMNEKESKLEQISELKTQIQLERVTFHHNVRSILTDDQKLVFDQHTLKHPKGDRHNGQMGHRGPQKGMGGNGQNRPYRQNNQNDR